MATSQRFPSITALAWLTMATLHVHVATTQTTNMPITTVQPDDAFPAYYVAMMIVFGLIGCILIPAMCVHSLINFSKNNTVNIRLRVFYSLFFAAYSSTCIGYTFFRTDLFLPMGTSIPCTFGYYFTTNSVYVSKSLLYAILAYRIDLAFHSSAMGYPRSCLVPLAVTMLTVVAVLNVLFILVTKDIVVFEEAPYLNGAISGICTSGSGESKYSGYYQYVMGGLFVGDFFSNAILLGLFCWKLNVVIKMGADCSGHDRKLQKLMKKQTILVSIACVTSLLVFVLGAGLSGFSLIMPLDATVNAFCIWLMFSFSNPIWNKIAHFCCCCDCCGHKQELMMTLHSMRSIRGSSLRQEAISSTRSPSVQCSTGPQRVADDEAPPPISERVSEKHTDIEIKFENDITPDDLKKKPA